MQSVCNVVLVLAVVQVAAWVPGGVEVLRLPSGFLIFAGSAPAFVHGMLRAKAINPTSREPFSGAGLWLIVSLIALFVVVTSVLLISSRQVGGHDVTRSDFAKEVINAAFAVWYALAASVYWYEARPPRTPEGLPD